MTSWARSALSDHNPEPLYYTPRNPHRDTIGPDIAKVLARCQKKLITPMPWQRDFLDCAGELDTATGLLWYRTIVLILPRQGGKTTLVRAKLSHRGITQPGAQMLYTAQDRNSARKRLEKTIYEPLRDSTLSKYLAKPRWSPGSEVVRFQNRSELRIESLSKTAGHGDTLDEAHIDEAFAHKDNRIEQNVSPTMITVQGAQKWFTSAAGTVESVLLNGKQEKGRLLAASGRDSRTLYWEYGAPEGSDPDDPATYLCHPAIGHTILLEDIIDERDTMDPTEFERAYLSWTPKPQEGDTPIPMAAWRANYVNPEYETWRGKPMWCVDMSPDRAWSAIGLAASSVIPGSRAFVEVVEHEEGAAWVLPRLIDLANRFGGRRVCLDAGGAAGSLEEDLIAAGFEVIMLTVNERMDACGQFYDDVIDEKIRYLEDPVLTGAMAAAAKMRVSGGEAEVFVRGKSRADISPLYSVVLARYAFVRLPAEYDVLDTIA